MFEMRPPRCQFVIIIGAHHRACSPRRSASCKTTSSASSPIRPARSSATCSSRSASAAYSIGIFHLHPRLLQGAAVPWRGLGHHRDAPRAGHAPYGRIWRKIPFTLAMMTIGTLALTGIVPFTSRLFLQRTRSSRLSFASHRSMAFYGFLTSRHRRRADLILFLAAGVPDLLWRSALGRRSFAR